MKPGFTISYLEQQKTAGKIKGYEVKHKAQQPVVHKNPEGKKKKSKYSSTKTEVDGILFDSNKESKRYKQLKLLLKTGHIAFLKLQVPFELNEGGTHSLKYIADFVYVIRSTGERVVEDAKGYRTQEYKKKRRLMLKVHGIEIKEV